MTPDKVRENRVRRQAKRLGLALKRSRAKHVHLDDLGEYCVVDPNRNAVVRGERFDWSLDDVEGYLNEAEEALRKDPKAGLAYLL